MLVFQIQYSMIEDRRGIRRYPPPTSQAEAEERIKKYKSGKESTRLSTALLLGSLD